MKKYLLIILAAAAVIASCGKEKNGNGNDDPEENTPQEVAIPLTFDLRATHPDATKARKSGWETGDVIFVFFSNVASPRHLRMTYNNGSWKYTEYNGSTAVTGAIELAENASGTMTAVFLPYGSASAVSASGTDFVFDDTYYTYYLTDQIPYTVTDGIVKGRFIMEYPADYVKFLVEDYYPEEDTYTLSSDAVIPVGIASVAADGTVKTTDGSAGGEMPGYVYDNGEDLVGYLFCGKLNPAYSYAGSYYFVKTDVSATPHTRADFFVSDKTLTGNYSVKLPFNTDPKWVAVGGGSSYSVELKTADNASLGTWYTCDYGAFVPEAPGTQYSFANANNISGVTVPDKSRFEALIENCSWTKLTVHGQTGFLGSAASGFLFFPANAGYWSSTDPWSCSFSTDAAKPSMSDGSGTGTGYCVRPVLD